MHNNTEIYGVLLIVTYYWCQTIESSNNSCVRLLSSIVISGLVSVMVRNYIRVRAMVISGSLGLGFGLTS